MGLASISWEVDWGGGVGGGGGLGKKISEEAVFDSFDARK